MPLTNVIMKTLLLACLLAGGVVTAQAQSTPSRPLTSAGAKTMAVINQEAILGGTTALTAQLAPLTSSSSGFGTTRMVTKLPGSPVMPMPRMNIPSPVDQGVAIAAAVAWMDGEFPGFKSRVGVWLAEQGVSTAVFNYTQEIMVNTIVGPKKKAMAFNAVIDRSGRVTHGAPKIVDADPTILEATYVPLAPAAGLPASWRYPDAGQIAWRVLNKRYEPLSGWKLEQVYGAFDQPQVDGNPDAGLACLVDKRNTSGCPGATDIRNLMDAAGTSFGLVSYIRTLEPVYTANGDGTESAQSAISVDSRSWDCINYNNKGNFGFLLSLRADQFLVRPLTGTTSYNLIQQYAGQGISPNQAYDLSVPVASLGATNPDSVIISPDPTDPGLWARSDPIKMKNVVYVGPVTAPGAGSNIAFYGSPVSSITEIGDDKDYNFGMHSWGDGWYQQDAYFNLNSVKELEKFVLKYVGFDDWQNVSINGQTVFNGPRGGDMLKYEMAPPPRYDQCSPGGAGYTCYDTAYNESGGTVIASAPVTHSYCSLPYFGEISDGPGNKNWTCSTGACPQYTVQYNSNPVLCDRAEYGQWFAFTPNVDLLPYLRAGQNHISLTTLVARLGGSLVTFTARMCGYDMVKTAPPIPVTGGVGGVDTNLQDKLKAGG
jgi:hypothetical protein